MDHACNCQHGNTGIEKLSTTAAGAGTMDRFELEPANAGLHRRRHDRRRTNVAPPDAYARRAPAPRPAPRQLDLDYAPQRLRDHGNTGIEQSSSPSPAKDLTPLAQLPDPRLDAARPADALSSAEDRVARARALSTRLFKEAKRMPQYKLVLANKGRVAEFRAALLEKAGFINRKLDRPLCAADVAAVTDRLDGRVAVWEHTPERQRRRQQKQAAKRRREKRGRDLWILRKYEDGMSPAKIAKEMDLSRSGVRHILRRDLPSKGRSPEKSRRKGGGLPVAVCRSQGGGLPTRARGGG